MVNHILAVTPVMKEMHGKARLYGRALSSIYWQQWTAGRVDHFMPSGGDDHFDSNGTVTAKYQLAREVFLAGNYEWFAALEYDMICPDDALLRLAELDADIAYGLYVFRHTGMRKWNAANRMERGGAAWMSDAPDHARAAWGHVAKVQGCGLGVTLIKRHVIEALPFHHWKGVCCDWALACDALAAGYSQVLDTRIVCGHMTLTPSPQILWPDVNEEHFYRTEFLG